jgi:hypothetical protein
MTHTERVTRVSEWMRFWAPEVKRRADKGEALFIECRDAYVALTESREDELLMKACWERMKACGMELDKAPPGAYDHLAHIGAYVR